MNKIKTKVLKLTCCFLLTAYTSANSQQVVVDLNELDINEIIKTDKRIITMILKHKSVKDNNTKNSIISANKENTIENFIAKGNKDLKTVYFSKRNKILAISCFKNLSENGKLILRKLTSGFEIEKTMIEITMPLFPEVIVSDNFKRIISIGNPLSQTYLEDEKTSIFLFYDEFMNIVSSATCKEKIDIRDYDVSSDGSVFILSLPKKIMAFDTYTGKILWEYKWEGAELAKVLIDANDKSIVTMQLKRNEINFISLSGKLINKQLIDKAEFRPGNHDPIFFGKKERFIFIANDENDSFLVFDTINSELINQY